MSRGSHVSPPSHTGPCAGRWSETDPARIPRLGSGVFSPPQPAPCCLAQRSICLCILWGLSVVGPTPRRGGKDLVCLGHQPWAVHLGANIQIPNAPGDQPRDCGPVLSPPQACLLIYKVGLPTSPRVGVLPAPLSPLPSPYCLGSFPTLLSCSSQLALSAWLRGPSVGESSCWRLAWRPQPGPDLRLHVLCPLDPGLSQGPCLSQLQGGSEL